MNLLEVTNLTKIYRTPDQGEEVVFENLQFSLPENQITIIRGPSGCGKSTLLGILGLLDQEFRGEILLRGKNVSQLSEKKQAKTRREQLGFVYQDYSLIRELTVLENVMLPLRLLGENKKDAQYQAEEWLKKVGLNPLLFKKNPLQLSGGQQQRAGVARALIHQPYLILADEPTGNLDDETAEVVIQLLIDYSKIRKKNLILVTHNKEAEKWGNLIFHFRKEGNQPAQFIRQ